MLLQGNMFYTVKRSIYFKDYTVDTSYDINIDYVYVE